MLTLPPTIGLAEAKDVMRPLQKAVASEPADCLTLDASGLQQFDSAALAVVLECRRLATSSGRKFVLHAPPSRLRQLARLYGVAELLGISSAPPMDPAQSA